MSRGAPDVAPAATETVIPGRAPLGSPDEDGSTLIEAIVAGTLGLVVLLIALQLVRTLRFSYLRSEAAADAAGRLRIAAETISRELRLAGLGVDPDGAPGRPDEAIEGAWAGAIAIRADLDGDDPAARDDPESWIAGIFPSTRTGNDEIVVYALRREDGTGGSDLVFEADVTSPGRVTTSSGLQVAPRDGLVETVRLPRIVAGAGGAAGSGCVLYRGTIASNAALWGTASAITWQPLADRVSRLGFRYFDSQGVEIPPAGGAESVRDERARIDAVEARLVVLEDRVDANWSDPSDTDPSTAGYRRAATTFRVALRNGGRLARADRGSAPPWPPP